jgi:hypothetical protein
MNTIEIFKTNVKSKRKAIYLLHELKETFPEHRISIDLEDNDKILRVENRKGEVKAAEVINLLKKRNFNCEILK